ncbi:hypothetical protein G4Y79_02250 [Phototrophicus methaneseepsis]|uniref:STAS/SEC14 domain-containing protein n=1 Tax=Phototrophicus methaneseepsis TaxID=2710758 RepID=A0A7S8IF72_9CHLR|nr:hypothetical protein [Phototrophicus methaneseepsis]QPC83219.1 hypothetical protein G4Y79_02250 [Phototrophicus methaneseepsis]
MVLDEDNRKSCADGFSYYQDADGIIFYYVHDLKHDTVDCFVETVHRMDLLYYEANRHCRSLTDFSRLSYPTPYAMMRIQDMVRSTPAGLRESVAILTPTSMINTFIRSVMKNLPVTKTGPMRLFTDREAAMTWLVERLKLLGP